MELRELVKQEQDLPREPFPCPEWPSVDGKLFIRTLGAAELDAWKDRNLIRDRKGPRTNLKNIRARFFTLIAVDESGNRAFKDTDADWLGEKNSKVIDRAWDIGNRLCANREEDLEELEKNSPTPTANGESNSASPSPADAGT